MTVVLFVAAIFTASLGAWWAAGIFFAMGLAYAHDQHLCHLEAERRRDRRCRAELARHREEAER